MRDLVDREEALSESPKAISNFRSDAKVTSVCIKRQKCFFLASEIASELVVRSAGPNLFFLSKVVMVTTRWWASL